MAKYQNGEIEDRDLEVGSSEWMKEHARLFKIHGCQCIKSGHKAWWVDAKNCPVHFREA